MSKGLVGRFLGLVNAILTDYVQYHPDAARSVERDKTRIMSLASNSGSAFFTLTLPALGAVFDRALETGRLTRTGVPLTRSINTRTVIPRLFQDIWSRVFDDVGCLRQDVDANDVSFMRSLCYSLKKYRLQCSDTSLFRTSKEYVHVDQQLPLTSPIWDGDGASLSDWGFGSFTDRNFSINESRSLFVEDEHLADAELLALAQSCADRVSLLIGDYVVSEHRFKHGPGATAEYARHRSYKYSFPSWSSRLQRVFPADVFGVPNTSLLGVRWSDGVVFPSMENHSRLIAVPKTQKGPRLIAAEPTCHQWCQQGVRSFLNARIEATWLSNSIDFRRQDLSGDLARVASHTGEYATLDLKEASDRLSTWLVERMFRKNKPLLEALIACRTRYVHQDIDKSQPSLLKLRKFASMGSALTFPIQSIVFLTVCLAAGCKAESLSGTDAHLKRLSRRVRVYGDDLIVPVKWVPFVQQILKDLFLKVNVQKSFWNGKFREACGTDAYGGYVVSPTYVREMYDESKPSTLISVIDTCNNAYNNGLWHMANYLLSTIPKDVRKLIPLVRKGSGSFGLETASGFLYRGKNRYNRNLQRWESLSYAIRSIPKKTTRHEGVSNLLQFFTEAQSRDGVLSHLTELPIETGLFGAPEQKLTLRWEPVGV